MVTHRLFHLHNSWEQQSDSSVLQPGCGISDKQGMLLIRFRAISEKEGHVSPRRPSYSNFDLVFFTPLQKENKEVIPHTNQAFIS